MRFSTSWTMQESELEPLRIGFIGAGAMAEFAVYPGLYFAPLSLQAVCDIDERRAKYMAGKFGSGRYYTSYSDMFKQEDLEAVVVQMHPKPRHKIVLDVLEAGYHVFMPKPPAMSWEDTQALSRAADKRNKHVMINFQSRFSFAVMQARKIMNTSDFGSLTQISSSFCTGKYSGGEDEVRGQNYIDPIHAYLLDFTPHHLDLCRYLAGEVKKMALYHNQQTATGSYALALEFENGAVGTMQLNNNRLWWRNYDRIELTGEGEYVVLESLWKLRHYTKDQNTFSENYRDERSGELTGDAGAMREFVNAIRADREPIASIHDCVHTMQLYQTIYDAVKEGRDGVILET